MLKTTVKTPTLPKAASITSGGLRFVIAKPAEAETKPKPEPEPEPGQTVKNDPKPITPPLDAA
jgi:hypothetical protein